MNKIWIWLLIFTILFCSCQSHVSVESVVSGQITAATSQENIEKEESDFISANSSYSENTQSVSNNAKVPDIRTVIDNKTPYSQKITQEYAENDIKELIGQGVNSPFISRRYHWSNLFQSYKVECVRQTDTTLYCILKTKENGLLYLFFHAEFHGSTPDNPIVQYVAYSKKRLQHSDFKKIKKGDTMEDVRKIDPAMEFLFKNYNLYKDKWPDGTKDISLHLLADGTITIRYQYDGNKKQVYVTGTEYNKNFQAATAEGPLGAEYIVDLSILPQDYIH